jgi:hypothetical protein
MASTLKRQAQREFLYRQAGGNYPLKSTTQLLLEYYTGWLLANGVTPPSRTRLSTLQVMWAKKYISVNGGTPPPGNYMSQLWRQLCVVKGFNVSKNKNDNEITFYLNS